MRPLLTALLAAALLGGAALGDEPPALAVTGRLLLSDLEPFRERGERRAELFFASVRASVERKGWGARAELRGREGRFRDYFPGPLWLEEGYAWLATPLGEARVGKLAREVGLPDDTFGGTLFSFAGVTRNPDWGAGLKGQRDLGHDTLGWSLQYLGRNDRIAWEDEGFGVEGDPAAALRDAFSGRVTYKWGVQFPWLSVTPGVSGETARVVREGGLDFRRSDLALELTGALGPVSLGLEWLTRSGEERPPAGLAERPGYGDARAFQAAFAAEFPNVVWRYVYSEWRYASSGANERQHLGSASWSPRKGIEGIIEISGRRFRGRDGVRTFNAVRLGLSLTFSRS